MRQPPFLIQGSHDGFKGALYVSGLPGLGSRHQCFPGPQPMGTLQISRGQVSDKGLLGIMKPHHLSQWPTFWRDYES